MKSGDTEEDDAGHGPLAHFKQLRIPASSISFETDLST